MTSVRLPEPAGPRPLAAPGVVSIDATTRSLVVRPARDARAYAKVLWADGVRAQAEASARRSSAFAPPTVWASGGGKADIAYGLPAGSDGLAFRFSVGDPVYKALVSTPGLSASIVVDRASSQILAVRFRGA